VRPSRFPVRLVLTTVLALVALARWTAAEAQAPEVDPALVLRYTFDADAQGSVPDRSAYGNHGTLVGGRYLPEFAGRQGVLRCDGEEAVLRCPDSDSLFFDGDLSFEMWVRLNAPVKATWATLFGDGDGLAFYIAYWHSVVLWYSTYNEDLRAWEGMDLPVEADILGPAWSHLAVVVEYPRCRFYCNGRLVRDSYMPIPGVMHRSRVPKMLGKSSPIDLDEFRLYRRALSPAEIAAHAAGVDMPPTRNEELAVEPNWYDSTLGVRVTCKGPEYAGSTATIVLARSDDTPLADPQEVPLTAAFAGCGRYAGTAVFALALLERQALDATARLTGPAGDLGSVRRRVTLTRPEWVNSAAGRGDEVLPPWTPVQAAPQQDGAVRVRVWGRTHDFGPGPFLRQLESRGVALLTAPIRLTGRAAGREFAWSNGQTALEEHSDSAVVLRQSAACDGATFTVRARIEYDGYMLFDCTLTALRDLALEDLRLEIPLDSRSARLCYGNRVLPENDQIPIAEWYSGAVTGDLAFRFSPCIWLGDEERGLCWQAESDEDWHCAAAQKAIEILPRAGTTLFVAHWIDTPTDLPAGKSLRYRFALEGTPVKPMTRDAWDLRVVRSEPYGADLDLPDRKTADGTPVLESYAAAGIRRLFTNVNDVWPYPLPVHAPFAEALRRLLRQGHAAGLKLHPYVIHERFPTLAPEFDTYGLAMANRPMQQYIPGGNPPGDPRPGPITYDFGANSQGTVFHCPKSVALQDAYVHSLARRLAEYGDDGVYLDGTAHAPPCRNTAHGCGYRRDGVVRPTYPVFAAREFMKRIYTVVRKSCPDGIVDVHCSWGYNVPALAYSDLFWTGEQWWHLRGTGAKDGFVAAELTLDRFRTEFMGTPIGVPGDTLAYRLGPQMRVAATALLHDVPVRPSSTGLDQLEGQAVAPDGAFLKLMLKLWRLRDAFGTREAEKHFYWDNAAYVRVSPPGCYATLFRHPTHGALVFLSNLTPAPQTAVVELNLDTLRLRGSRLGVFNALTDAPLALSADGSLAVPLGSEEWLYVWLRPTRH
jgi:hypothetical protein